MMRANTMKPRSLTSSFSKHEKMRRVPSSVGTGVDFVAALVHLPVVFPRVKSSLERRHHRREPQLQRQLASLITLICPTSQLRTASLAGTPGARVACVSPARYAPVQQAVRTAPPFAHPRQQDESWWSCLPGTCRWPTTRVFSRPSPVGVHPPTKVVQRTRLQLDLLF